jgi:hypothetical protein
MLHRTEHYIRVSTDVPNESNAFVFLVKQSKKTDDEGKAPLRNVGDCCEGKRRLKVNTKLVCGSLTPSCLFPYDLLQVHRYYIRKGKDTI